MERSRGLQGYLVEHLQQSLSSFPEKQGENAKCQGLVSFVICWCVESLMEEVITLLKLLGCLGAGGTDWGKAATEARSSLHTAFNYSIVSA